MIKEISLASIEDVNQIHHIDFLNNPNPWTIKQITQSILQKNVLCYKQSEKIISFLITLNCVDFYEIHLIATHPSFQRQYSASFLLKEFIHSIKEKNCPKILLEVRESNIIARTFYQSLGFENCSRRKNYYSHPDEDAIIMEKKC